MVSVFESQGLAPRHVSPVFSLSSFGGEGWGEEALSTNGISLTYDLDALLVLEPDLDSMSSNSTQAIQHLVRADKILGRLINQVGPCTLKAKNGRSPFEALVQSVTYQQLNGTAAATILGRVKALYPGRRFPGPQDVLATPDVRLRGAGLSRAKTATIKDLATHALGGVVPSSRAIRKS